MIKNIITSEGCLITLHHLTQHRLVGLDTDLVLGGEVVLAAFFGQTQCRTATIYLWDNNRDQFKAVCEIIAHRTHSKYVAVVNEDSIVIKAEKPYTTIII